MIICCKVQLHQQLFCFLKQTVHFKTLNMQAPLLKYKTSGKFSKSLSMQSCGGPSASIKIRDIVIMPDPVVVPGTMIVAYTMEVLKDLNAPIGVDYKIEKHIFADEWIPLSCVNTPYGTCNIQNVCNILWDIQPCPSMVNEHAPCQCPVLKNNYTMGPMPIPIQGGFVVAGKYRTRIKVDNWEHGDLMCYDFALEVFPASP
ncbi:ganglioside GM2 activator-like isoform X1 [Biomphalaria glabrata]|uniref:Ganglioside GM2 activator-like isoform X1 n=1 Tax=Biomphalaria glabrata TaxID=6526 RepID=A0A9W2Z2E8_BIOGL|nr:ganglioside GM2 activator-like isoform X1 [Biomphalaria glabrata]